MTPSGWLEHAAKCRELAKEMDDDAARRVLLAAADDYQRLAGRDQAVQALHVANMVPRPRAEVAFFG